MKGFLYSGILILVSDFTGFLVELKIVDGEGEQDRRLKVFITSNEPNSESPKSNK